MVCRVWIKKMYTDSLLSQNICHSREQWHVEVTQERLRYPERPAAKGKKGEKNYINAHYQLSILSTIRHL